MNRYYIFIYLFVFSGVSFAGYAQQAAQANDTTVRLHEVVVSGVRPLGLSREQRFSAGTPPLRYSRPEIMRAQKLSLSDYLQANTAIYFKEAGKGMSAAVSIRGTSASQTAVQWNGLDISMASMGQTDFSLLPLFFFDAIEVHRSGEGALYGNGAIGGCIQLLTLPLYKKGIAVDFKQSVGSYGFLLSGLGVRVAGKNWESRTQALYSSAKNNFTFKNTTNYNREERMENAAFRQYGLLQEVYFRPADKQELSVKAWYTDSERQIQPVMSCNGYPQYYDSITDRSLRLMAAYSGVFDSLQANVYAGYSYDYEHFREDLIALNKTFVKAEAEYTYRNLLVKLGGQAEYIRPDVHAYADGLDEWRTAAFLLARWDITPKLLLTGGLRKNIVTGVSVPVAPSVGITYRWLQDGAHSVKLRTAFSYNTKIPTLNDRYWGGENTYLKPEKGHNTELGIDYDYSSPAWTVQAYATGYYNRIKDWIRWIPRAWASTTDISNSIVWRPENMALVDSYGAEAGSTLQTTVGAVGLLVKLNYSYTAVILRENGPVRTYSIGKQVPYQPLHIANATADLSYNKWLLRVATRYTGSVHTTDYFQVLDDYFLTGLHLGYTFHHGKYTVTLQAQADNIFGTVYENVKHFAMPGRTYTVSLTFKI